MRAALWLNISQKIYTTITTEAKRPLSLNRPRDKLGPASSSCILCFSSFGTNVRGRWLKHDVESRVAPRNSDYLCALDGRSGRRSPTPCRTSDRVAIPASSAARRSASRNCSGAIFPLNASTQAFTAATYSSPSSQGQSLIRRRAASPSVHTILRDAGPRKAKPTGVNADDVFQHIVLDPSRHGYCSPQFNIRAYFVIWN